MNKTRQYSSAHFLHFLLCITITAVVLQALGAVAVVVPISNCYALDNSSRIVDFTSWIGQPFEYEGQEPDLVVRFCKDVETRSQTVAYKIMLSSTLLIMLVFSFP